MFADALNDSESLVLKDTHSSHYKMGTLRQSNPIAQRYVHDSFIKNDE